MAHLDGVAEALRQTFEEVFEDTHPFDVEGRWKLQERSEPVAELGHRVRKFSASASAPTKFRSWVITFGNFAANRNPSGATSRQFCSGRAARGA